LFSQLNKYFLLLYLIFVFCISIICIFSYYFSFIQKNLSVFLSKVTQTKSWIFFTTFRKHFNKTIASFFLSLKVLILQAYKIKRNAIKYFCLRKEIVDKRWIKASVYHRTCFYQFYLLFLFCL
jgi:hypothetical protein